MRTCSVWLTIVSVTVVLAWVSLAAAESAPEGDARAAEALFAEAQTLMDRGDYRSACPKLEESFRLDPATGALFALAFCHEQIGLHASAWVEFMDAASRANAERYPEREQVARAHAAALLPKLSFLTVRVDAKTAALAGVVVTCDGVRLGTAAWDTALPIDPGRHVVAATAPGHQRWQGEIVIGNEPQRESVAVPPLAVLPAPKDEPKAPAPRPKAEAERFEITPLRAVAIGLGGAALAAFGVATYASVRAIQKNADSKDDCNEDNVCGTEGDRDRTSAREAATVAGVSAIVGGVFLASGVALFIAGAPEAPEAGGAGTVPTGLSLRISGTF